MARIRTIKPEFPQSESMGQISRDARLCFVLMWTLADDEGRLRGNSRMLASLLFPYDDDAPALIVGWLEELESVASIQRYKDGGDSYIQITKWLSHQKIDKPSRSKIPQPQERSRILANPRESSLLDQGSRIKDQGEDQDQYTPAGVAGPDGPGVRVDPVRTGPSKPKPTRPKTDEPLPPEFLEAWGAYPARPGNSRVDALKAWRARVAGGADP